jgi:hypothetical protein
MINKFTGKTTVLVCIAAMMWSVLAHAQIEEEFTSPSLGAKFGYVFFKDGMDLKEYRLNVSTNGPLLMEFAIRDFKNYGGSLDIPFRKFLATDGNVVPYFLIGPGLDFWHTSIRMSYTTEELSGFKEEEECEVYALARDIWGNWVPVERCYTKSEPIFETVHRDYTDTSNTLMGGGHFGFGGMLSAYPLFFDGKFKTRYALGKDFFESGSSLLHEIRITLEIRNDIVLSSALDFEAALIYEGVISDVLPTH